MNQKELKELIEFLIVSSRYDKALIGQKNASRKVHLAKTEIRAVSRCLSTSPFGF